MDIREEVGIIGCLLQVKIFRCVCALYNCAGASLQYTKICPFW